VTFDVDSVGLSGWLGTHALLDPVRGKGRRRRWFVDVRALGQLPDLGPFDPDAIGFAACRSGGPGGQHVNTTASAVQATYRPTGWQVRVADERSQHRNKAEAVRRLRLRHQEARAQQQAHLAQRRWRAHEALVRGAPVQTWQRRRGRLVPSPADPG
jgi:peptide chain release factor